MGQWYGWARLRQRGWVRLTGPHPKLGEAVRALDAEIHKRELTVEDRDTCLTSGTQPQRPPGEGKPC
jgi:hypothetical protein